MAACPVVIQILSTARNGQTLQRGVDCLASLILACPPEAWTQVVQIGGAPPTTAKAALLQLV